MKCDRVRELVSDALDGILDDAVEKEFHGHLKSCPPCRVFHEEMRESLLVLNELPVVEVSDDFDEAVWRQVRELAPPRSVRAHLRQRLAEAWSRFEALPGFARWTPAAVAATLLMMVAISPSPAPGPRVAEVDPPAGESAAAEPVGLLAAAPEPAPSPHVVETPPASPEAAPEEVFAGMPEAVEAFLKNARELRLQADPDRYRRSNYSYPLRRVPTPRLGHNVSAQPVPVSATSAESEVRVISF